MAKNDNSKVAVDGQCPSSRHSHCPHTDLLTATEKEKKPFCCFAVGDRKSRAAEKGQVEQRNEKESWTRNHRTLSLNAFLLHTNVCVCVCVCRTRHLEAWVDGWLHYWPQYRTHTHHIVCQCGWVGDWLVSWCEWVCVCSAEKLLAGKI